MELLNLDTRKYVIFDTSEIDKIDFEEVLETSASTLRYSVNGLKTFVKYDGDMPSSVFQLSSKSIEYSHSEILAILATEEWTPIIIEE
jgi:hypothetical protein